MPVPCATWSSECRYARCSTVEQQREGGTLDAQADRIRHYCQTHRLDLGPIFVDAGVSGGVALSQRPHDMALFDAIGRREVAAAVSLKLDRLFRSTLDCLETVKRWDAQRVALTLIDFAGGALDTKTAMGKFFLTMAAGFGPPNYDGSTALAVSIQGPVMITAGNTETWTADITGGVAPYTVQWSGVLDGTGSSVAGSPTASGTLFLDAWDANGAHVATSTYVTVCPDGQISC